MMDETIRCFLGMELTTADRASIEASLGYWRGQPWAPPVRWVAARNWHVTLVFLGNRTMAWLKALHVDLAEPFRQTQAGGSVIRASGLRIGCFPDVRGRIVALEWQPDPALLLLKAQLDALLQRHGVEPETRTFRPHITLGRFERRQHEPVMAVPFTATLTFSRLTLFQSTPTPQGSDYQPVWSLPLPDGTGVDGCGQTIT